MKAAVIPVVIGALSARVCKHTYIEPMILSHEVLETSLPVMIPSKHTRGYITAARLD